MNIEEAIVALVSARTLQTALKRAEREGQRHIMNSWQLPRKMLSPREAFEAVGVVFGEDVGDLFVLVTLPEGWTKRGGDNAMQSAVLDGHGRKRISVFYKAAFYDRRASMRLLLRFSVEVEDQIQDEWGPRRCVVKAAGELPLMVSEWVDCDDYEAHNRVDRECRGWLDEHWPEWQDPTAYWGTYGCLEMLRFKDDTGTTPGNWLEGVRQGAIPSTFGSDAITERARLLVGKGVS